MSPLLSEYCFAQPSKGNNTAYLRGGGENQGGDGRNAPLPKLSGSGNRDGRARQEERRRQRRSGTGWAPSGSIGHVSGCGLARVRAGAHRAAAAPSATGRELRRHRRAGSRQAGLGWSREPGRGSGWHAVGGGGPCPRPPHPGAWAWLWAGREPVSQAGFSLRLWGRLGSAAERIGVRPSPIRLRRPPARVFPAPAAWPLHPGSQSLLEPAPWREGSSPRKGAAARERYRAEPAW